LAVGLPHWSAIKGLQADLANVHIREAPKPDESVRTVEISELADHVYPRLLLGFDELPVEQLDQNVALARP
jgi:hypothetical protein